MGMPVPFEKSVWTSFPASAQTKEYTRKRHELEMATVNIILDTCGHNNQDDGSITIAKVRQGGRRYRKNMAEL